MSDCRRQDRTGGRTRLRQRRRDESIQQPLALVWPSPQDVNLKVTSGREHKDGNDCEDVTMEGGSHRVLGDRVLRGRRGRGAVVVMPHV